MQNPPVLSIALCATLQFRKLPANHRSSPKHKLEAAETPQAAAQGSRTSENSSRVHQLTLRYLCSPAANRILTFESKFPRDTINEDSIKKMLN